MTTSPCLIEFGPTKRGALVGKFCDRYGACCSIQESSYPEEDCVWLGVEIDAMGELAPNGRMHLTRDLARQLAEALLHFAHDGSLGLYDTTDYSVGNWVLGVAADNQGVVGRVVEARPGSLLKVKVEDRERGGEDPWEYAWSVVPASWVPTEPPPRGRSLFEHLEV